MSEKKQWLELMLKEHNDLIDIDLGKLSAVEIDVFSALCYRCCNQKSKEIFVTFDEIIELAQIPKDHPGRVPGYLVKMNKHLLELNTMLRVDQKIVQFTFFNTFVIDKKTRTLTVGINEIFQYMLNYLDEEFTLLDLGKSNSLKSKYAKCLYRKLRKFRFTGFYRVSFEDFQKYMDPDHKYKELVNFRARVLKPAVAELQEKIYPELKVRSIKEGHKLVGYEFTFTPESKDDPEVTDVIKMKKKLGYKATPYICPVCGKNLDEKIQTKKHGEPCEPYSSWCHWNFQTGGCDYWTTNIENLVQKQRLDSKEEKERRNKRKNDQEMKPVEIEEVLEGIRKTLKKGGTESDKRER